jgi:hypothetical protein
MSETNAIGLSQDKVFEVLKSPRRRYALYYLKRAGGEAELSEITEQVAAWENEIPPAKLASEQRKRVYISLYQTHMPKLDDAGVVEYDQSRGVVELAANARELDVYLGEDVEAIPWEWVYLGLSIGSVLLVAGVWTGVYPASQLSGLTTAVIVIAAFGITAIAQYAFNHRLSNGPEMPPELSTPQP